MGVVYAARNVRRGGRVAVKLMPPHDAQAFLLEARVLASLSHPHVVTIYDYGVVEEAFFGVPAGAPWLAMELLTPWGESTVVGSWEELRTLLLSVLDALRAVHARGILHRDLKPSNLLRDATGRWKVADFGVARVGHVGQARRVGTEGFGAPEQLAGRWWEVGPWSDVFSVGAVAAAVLESAPPFPTPSGLFTWVAQATAAAPADRFATAARALSALDDLGPPRPGAEPWRPPARVAEGETFFGGESADEVVDEPVRPPNAPPASPLPEVWPAPTGPGAPGSHLGLGVLGLRTPPYVGRNRERALVWSALRSTAAGQRRHLHLAGPVGSGRWRLAQECAWAAAEGEGARVVLVDGGAVGAALAQLLPIPPDRERGSRMITTHLRRPPDAPEVSALLEGLYRRAPVPLSQQAALVETVVRALASATPVVLALRDGVEGASDLVERLSEPGLAVLLLTTGSEAAPAGAEVVHLDPLTSGDIARLASSLVPFDPVPDLDASWPGALVARLATAAAAGGLLPTERGFRWVPGPWDQARAPAVDELAVDELPAWVLATWLGPHVDEERWSAHCAALAVAPCRARVDHWLRTGRLQPAPRGFVAPAPQDALTDALPAELRARLLDLVAEVVAGPGRLHAWLAAGRWDRVEAGWFEVQSALPRGMEVPHLERVERALRSAGRERSAAEVQGWRAWSLIQNSDVVAGTVVAEDLLALAERSGWDALVGSALHTLFTVQGHRGEELLERAIAAYERGGDVDNANTARLHLAQHYRPRWGASWLATPRRGLEEPFRHLVWALCLADCGEDASAREVLAATPDNGRPETRGYAARVLVRLRDWDGARRECASARAILADPSSTVGRALRAVEASVALLSGDPRAAANHLALGSVGPGTLGVASGVAAWRGDRAAFDAALAQLGPPQTDPFWRTVEAWALEGAADAWMGHGDAVRAAAARALRDARRWEPTA